MTNLLVIKMKNLIRKITPSFLISFYHFILALLGAIIYRFPSYPSKIKIIGVTGTNGKSTVVEMTSKILEEAGYKVASFSTIRFKIGEKEWPNALKMTMPGRLKVQRFLRQAVSAGCQYAVLEVTSEGIKQYRHKFIDFDIAVFTNLTPEHIEAHGRFENYRAAKGKLFQATKGVHIINLDDENAPYFLGFPAKEKWTYSLKEIKSPSYQLPVTNCRSGPDGIAFKIKDTQFSSRLIGEFNIYNALAAICIGLSQGTSLEICSNALDKVEVIAGRMEEVISEPFKVFVDYAFTPNALEKVYQTLKTNNQELKTARMICVLGACGGGRDKWKRPILGKIAATFCDEVIVTNEDPYDEDPITIIGQVSKGTNGKAIKIADRREAISRAINLARANDVVIITGKGCEPWICIAKGKKIPWDDRQVVKKEFSKLRNEKI